MSWPDARIVWMFLREGRGVYSNARLQAFSSRSGVYLSASFSNPIQDL